MRCTRPPSWSISTGASARPTMARKSSTSARNCAAIDDVALEQDQSPRPRVADERALFGAEARPGAAEDNGADHCASRRRLADANGNQSLATKQSPPPGLQLGAQRARVAPRQAADANAIDRLAFHVGLVDRQRGIAERVGVLALELGDRALRVGLRARRGELHRPFAAARSAAARRAPSPPTAGARWRRGSAGAAAAAPRRRAAGLAGRGLGDGLRRGLGRLDRVLAARRVATARSASRSRRRRARSCRSWRRRAAGDLGDSLVGKSSFGVAASGVATIGSIGANGGLHRRRRDGVGARRRSGRGRVGGGDQRPVRAHRHRLHRLGDREQRRDRGRGGGGRHDRRVGRGCDRRTGFAAGGDASAWRSADRTAPASAAASACAGRSVALPLLTTLTGVGVAESFISNAAMSPLD